MHTSIFTVVINKTVLKSAYSYKKQNVNRY